jgi:hypothetical protein
MRANISKKVKIPGIIKFPYPPCSVATVPVDVRVVVIMFKGDSILVAVIADTFPANKLLEMKFLIVAVVAGGGKSSLCMVYRLMIPVEIKSGGIMKYSLMSFLIKACVADSDVSKLVKFILPCVVT